jgi:hypothetical protein
MKRTRFPKVVKLEVVKKEKEQRRCRDELHFEAGLFVPATARLTPAELGLLTLLRAKSIEGNEVPRHTLTALHQLVTRLLHQQVNIRIFEMEETDDDTGKRATG